MMTCGRRSAETQGIWRSEPGKRRKCHRTTVSTDPRMPMSRSHAARRVEAASDGGAGKQSEKTVRKYLQDLDDFVRSLERHEMEVVLGLVTPNAINLWICRSRGTR